MKRCPECNRIDAEVTLNFCRLDGTQLIYEARSFAPAFYLTSNLQMKDLHSDPRFALAAAARQVASVMISVVVLRHKC
jgi:hypothetical protein